MKNLVTRIISRTVKVFRVPINAVSRILGISKSSDVVYQELATLGSTGITDPNVIDYLDKRGINTDDVEFYADYGNPDGTGRSRAIHSSDDHQ